MVLFCHFWCLTASSLIRFHCTDKIIQDNGMIPFFCVSRETENDTGLWRQPEISLKVSLYPKRISGPGLMRQVAWWTRWVCVLEQAVLRECVSVSRAAWPTFTPLAACQALAAFSYITRAYVRSLNLSLPVLPPLFFFLLVLSVSSLDTLFFFFTLCLLFVLLLLNCGFCCIVAPIFDCSWESPSFKWITQLWILLTFSFVFKILHYYKFWLVLI